MRSLLLTLLLAGTSSAALAAEYDRAQVTRVEPLYETVRVAEPRRECREEEVRHRGDSDSYTAPILGAIVGGVIGNEISDGRKVGSIAGAALGASIGRDIGRDDNGYTSVETRCTTRNVYREEERLRGYRVTYRYQGERYSTVTKEHPGKSIRVRVDTHVTPDDY